jgi:hypothetical protein
MAFRPFRVRIQNGYNANQPANPTACTPVGFLSIATSGNCGMSYLPFFGQLGDRARHPLEVRESHIVSVEVHVRSAVDGVMACTTRPTANEIA